MSKIDLTDKGPFVERIAGQLFDNIMAIPNEIRMDDKERTGIRILLREPGTRNMCFVAARNPSEATYFFAVEKAVRSEILGDYSSGNSADPNKFRFDGSLTYVTADGQVIQISMSGLKSEEDFAGALNVLSKVVNKSPYEVGEALFSGGAIFPESFLDPLSYLNKIAYS